tara:strand:+ start:1902 stop:2177 length:276 start_codon:yes stop_codon:yes gene_type:complete
MAKKEKVVDLKPKKISENQLKSLQDIVSFINQQQIQIGALETRKLHIVNEIIAKQGSLINLQNTFTDEYGTDNINIHDGVINYDDETDTKD